MSSPERRSSSAPRRSSSSGGRSAPGRGQTSSRGAGGARRSDGGRPSAGGRPGQPRRGAPAGRGGPSTSRGRTARPPATEAARRAAAVDARRTGPKPPRDPAAEADKIANRTVETWIDEGSVRDEAVAATTRASGSARPRGVTALDPEAIGALRDAVGERRAPRLIERLGAASEALDRDRNDEARRMVAPVLREAPGVAAGHEVAGLADYRRGRWKQALASLETARSLRPSTELLPVIADCQRALRRWADVERTWAEIKRASPSHEVMAEGRIVAAGALADRGELPAAIAVMAPATAVPKKVREHHLRQWYVLGDLHDRAGDVVGARRWFRLVAQHDPAFVDVADRLRSVGR